MKAANPILLRPASTVTIGGRDMCRVVYWPEVGPVEVVLGEGVTKKEVRKLVLFDGKELDFVCPDCEGAGEVPCDELDRDSMQYQRGVGVTKCLCQYE